MRRRDKVTAEDMDPDHARWKKRHSKFPGVSFCVRLLRRPNIHGPGTRVETICGELRDNAATHADELITAFQAESDVFVRRLLLGAIAGAHLPAAMPVFIEQLCSSDESLRYWAEVRLRSLNTPEARKALWEAGLKK